MIKLIIVTITNFKIKKHLEDNFGEWLQGDTRKNIQGGKTFKPT